MTKRVHSLSFQFYNFLSKEVLIHINIGKYLSILLCRIETNLQDKSAEGLT